MKTTIGLEHAFSLVILGCALSVVLISLAMFYYPGGTSVDTTTEGYSFVGNFLGDLGRKPLSLSGHPNRTSPWLFALALIAAGGALTLFFAIFPFLLRVGTGLSILEWLGSMAGVAAGLCLIGVALTPVNKYWVEHNQLATWACEEITVACVCYMVVTLGTPHYPKRYALAFLLLVAVTAGYLSIYLFGPPLNTPSGQMIQSITQKIIALASVATLAFESWGAYQVSESKQGQLAESEPFIFSGAPFA